MTRIDAATLQTLIDAHGAALALYARQWCRCPDDAVQESLIELAQQVPAPTDPAGWMYTTVRRRAMNYARSEGRRSKHQEAASRQRVAWFTPDDREPELALDCERLLQNLPQLEREIIVARIWGERSFAQIGQLVELPTSTVHRRYQDALAQMERCINQPEPSR